MAMKSTYLFVYPRLLLVDVRINHKAFIANVQMERSWLDNHTTESSANRLAGKVSEELKRLIAEWRATAESRKPRAWAFEDGLESDAFDRCADELEALLETAPNS